jgi:hypothetical protein
MFKQLFTHRRRQAPRYPAGLDERRTLPTPAPLPRMRWY